MKTRFPLILLTLLLLAGLLSACTGGASATNSWPGLSVSPDEQTAYLAYNNHVVALNTANGSVVWQYPEKTDNKITFFAAPSLTSDGQLIVGGYNHVLYSLDPASGKENWAFSGANNRYIASPLVSAAGIFAPTAGGILYAVSPQNNQLWSFPTPHGLHALWATPASDGKALYQPSMDHKVYAIDAASGKQLWESEDLGGSMVGNPTLSADGKVLYVGTLGRALVALDTQTGKELNRYATAGWVWSGPAEQDGRLYFGDLNGYFYALNASNLSEIWKIQPDPAVKAISDRPLIANGVLYFGSENGSLYAVNPENGSQVWAKVIGGRLFASPQLAGDKLLVAPAGADSQLVALDMNGNVVWSYPPPKS